LRDTFVEEKIRISYPEYATIKYPEPLRLEDFHLKSDEVLIEYEITEEETFIFLVSNEGEVKCFTVPINREELSKLTVEYIAGFHGIKKVEDLYIFDPHKGKELYDLLFKDVMTCIKADTRIIIVPDEVLSTLPFETLVTCITRDFKMIEGDFGPYPDGIKYAGDDFFISYYQSASALNAIRTLNKGWARNGLFGVADPVFNLSDLRVEPHDTNISTGVENHSYSETGNLKLFHIDLSLNKLHLYYSSLLPHLSYLLFECEGPELSENTRELFQIHQETCKALQYLSSHYFPHPDFLFSSLVRGSDYNRSELFHNLREMNK